MPRNSTSAPMPANAINPGVPPGRRNSPTTNIVTPMTVTTTPATRRRERIAANPSSGRIAATGGIFAARRDGTMTDAIVMPMPTSAAITTVRTWSTVRVSGNPAPAASKAAIRPRATSSPPRTPNIVANMPSTKASAEIIQRTWRAEAPTARRRASSRNRCPIVIWNTLLMMNALTNAVMKAKTSNPVPKTLTNWLTSSAVSWATCSPVTTSVCGGRMPAIACCTSETSASSATAMSIASTLPSAPKCTSAVSRSSATSCAPPKLSALPSPTVPTIVPSNVPTSVRYDTVSPSSKFSLSAVALSIASSSGPLGARPALIVTPWMLSSPCHDTPNVGPPGGHDHVAVGPDELGEPRAASARRCPRRRPG